MSRYDVKADIKYLEDNGIVFGEWQEVDDEFYHNSPGISASGLKEIDNKCPLAYKHNKTNKKEKTEAMLIGSAMHHYVLESEKFDENYIVSPVSDKRKREHKEFLLKNKGDQRSILRRSDMDMMEGVVESLKDKTNKDGDDTYSSIIHHKMATREEAIYIFDKDRQIILKVKTDIKMYGTLYDLKSTRNAKVDPFMANAAKDGYGIQAAFYIYVANLGPEEVHNFGFIAVEKEPPYLHSVIMVDEVDLALESVRVISLLDTYAECMHSGIWYGYNGIKDGKEPLMVTAPFPAWHRKQLVEL